VKIDFESADLEPLNRRVAAEKVSQLRNDESKLGDRLTYDD
jgi:hypothetical protein